MNDSKITQTRPTAKAASTSPSTDPEHAPAIGEHQPQVPLDSTEQHAALTSPGTARKRPSRLRFGETLASAIGWEVFQHCPSLADADLADKAQAAAIAKELKKLKWSKVLPLLADASPLQQSAELFLAYENQKSIEAKLQRRAGLVQASAIAALVRQHDPDTPEQPQLINICQEILASTDPESCVVRNKVLPPDFREYRLKASSKVSVGPLVSGTGDAKDSLLQYLDENPWQAPPVQELLRANFRRGSRGQVFVRRGSPTLPTGWVLTSLYPDDKVPVWVYANLVALDPSLDLLRRKHRCIEQALRILAFRQHEYDPHHRFWNGQHDAFGFVLRDVDQNRELSFLEQVELATQRARAFPYRVWCGCQPAYRRTVGEALRGHAPLDLEEEDDDDMA